MPTTPNPSRRIASWIQSPWLRTLTLFFVLQFAAGQHVGAQVYDTSWVFSSPGIVYVAALAAAPDGGLVVSGVFESTVDLDPGPEQALVTSHGGQDGFMLKLDAQGRLLWFRTWGGPADDSPAGGNLSIDEDGNIYAVGRFRSTIDFASAEGGAVLTSRGRDDCLVFKMDPDGHLLWFHRFGAGGNDIPHAAQVIEGGGLVVGGVFERTVDFSDGGGDVATSGGVTDAFVARFTQDGTLSWVRTVGSAGWDECWGVASDADGNVYCAGRISGPAGDFDPSVLTYDLTSVFHDAFIWKLTPDGQLAWVSHFPGAGIDVIRDVVVAPSGELYAGGRFQQWVDFDPSPGTDVRTVTGLFQNVFVARIDPDDGGLVWVRQLPTNETGGTFRISAGDDGSVSIGTRSPGAIDLDLGPGTTMLDAHGGDDAYVALLSRDGDFLYAGSVGGPGRDETFVSLIAGGDLYFAGFFSGNADLDPTPGQTDPFVSLGATDGFITRLRLNQPPVADAGPDQVVEATEDCAATVTLDGSGSFDPDGQIVSWIWQGDDASSAAGEFVDLPVDIGSTTLDLTVTDDHGAIDTDSVTIEVRDTVGPEIADATASPDVLWPPNHAFHTVSVSIAASDACGPVHCAVTSVTSNEPVDAEGDGTSSPDWQVIDASTVRLRAERSGAGTGRVYSIHLLCTDPAGNHSTGVAEVLVPRSRNRR